VTNRAGTGESPHQFGGDWTAAKLGVLGDYLRAYTTALKNKPFRKWYIDGFAGSGSILRGRSDHKPSSGSLFLPDQEDSTRILDGSALIALKTIPRFDHYVFIERDATRCEQLQSLRAEMGISPADVQVIQGDVNAALSGIQEANWSNRRAVLFLDPYGMQVEWRTIEMIATTKAIDLWVLFPLMGATRMLTTSGEIPPSWSSKLDDLFGTHDWYDRIYRKSIRRDLFGEEESLARSRAGLIGEFFMERLTDVFPGVVSQPGILRNSKGSPLFLLCFAVASDSEKAKGVALKIASHLLKRLN
jgi:three-Cys-motif partner protein